MTIEKEKNMNYIKSKYNSIIETINDGVLVLNTLTSAILWIPNAYWEYDMYGGDITDNWRELIDSGIWIEENRDEYEELKKHLKESVASGIGTLKITIAPTYACNMKCDYCFQHDKNEIIMSKSMADKIYDSIVHIISKYKSIVISWFGGEPLLALESISYLSKRLIEFCDANDILYNAEMITNGTLLTLDVAEVLVSLRVREMQITLDGTEHDKTRKMKNGTSSYRTIIENIAHATDLFAVVVRSNVTEENVPGIKKMIDELMLEYHLTNKVYFSFYPVSSFDGKSAKNCSFKKFCGWDVFASDLVDLIHHILKYEDSHFVANLYQMPSSVPCEAIFKDVVCFDAYGDIYKCSLAMQNEHLKIGNINESKIEDILNHGDQNGWLTFEWSDECKSCNFLPMCHSGCFFSRRVSGKDKICPINKTTHKKIAKILYELSEE